MDKCSKEGAGARSGRYIAMACVCDIRYDTIYSQAFIPMLRACS